jgi:Bacterial protein of unknown function (DUF899)
MCTAWRDGANGVAHHLAQHLDFAVVAAAADVPTLRSYARERGWDKRRLLSAGNNSFKYDLVSEDREGGQDSSISFFTRDAQGTLRHFYSAHPRIGPTFRNVASICSLLSGTSWISLCKAEAVGTLASPTAPKCAQPNVAHLALGWDRCLSAGMQN